MAESLLLPSSYLSLFYYESDNQWQISGVGHKEKIRQENIYQVSVLTLA